MSALLLIVVINTQLRRPGATLLLEERTHRQGSCSVTLVQHHSRAPCLPGVSFGCFGREQRFWVRQCRGLFHCKGMSTAVRCGYPAGAGFYNCSCRRSYLAESLAVDGESAHQSYKCSADQARAISGRFEQAGGVQKTRCPRAKWIQDYCDQLSPVCERPQTALVVGGNRGYDCSGWARLLSSSPMLTPKRWHAALKESLATTGVQEARVFRKGGACGQAFEQYPLMRGQQAPRHEPLPANVRVLAAARMAPWSGTMQVRAHLRY